ncbi:right-handed parallel beta-helix repeat-containing protein, partial [Candidatus Woesebacteria bacterium]|nr:right-handed parallel beta-helix repeat-containing protein [Candidatus Woesebacteria bacterium]
MNFKRKQKLFFLFTTLLFIAFTKYSNAATFYVPDNYSTIQSAVNAVSSGDTVYVRAGNYNEQFSISSSNITVAGIEGSRPRIYAGSMTGGEYLVTISGSNIRFRNFEIENTPVESAPQRALGVTGNDNLIENIKVHHSWKSGILITGDRNLLENNEVYLNSMRTDGRTSGTYSVTAQGEDNIIRNSLVYENDGEAISCFKGRRTIIENNISYNNRVNIYIDNCPGAIVRNNLAYQSEAGTGHASISVCDESYSTEREASDGLRIYNNFSMGGNGSLNIQGGSCWIGLTNATIAHNTFVNDSSDETFYLSGSSKDIVNTYVVNNIFVNTSSSRIASIGVSDPDLHFHHNLWSVAPSNSNARGEGDVIGDPLLAKIGPTSAGALTADWFRLLSNSPAIDHNNHVSGIYNDYFYNLRDSLPDYGGHEYNGTGGSTPTPYNTPTPRPSPTSTPIPSPTPPLSPNTVLRRVCSSSDDAEESVSGGSVTLSSSDLELTQENDNQ